MGNGGHPGKLQNNATDLFPRLGTGGFEDPFLYRDNHGGFHCLVHSMVGEKTCHRLGAMDGRGSCGAHLFSVDGVHWSTHATSGAYTGLIQYMYESSSLGESMGENSGEKLGESLGESLEGESMGENSGEKLGENLGESLEGESLGENLGESLGESLDESLGKDRGIAMEEAIVTRRERPYFIFLPEKCGDGIYEPCGTPVALLTAVQYPPKDGCFTLLQPLNT